MIHTPHRDKKRGTTRSMDVIEEHGVDVTKVVIDHNNEETVEEVLDRGYWAAFSIYPSTKMGNERMVEIVMKYGAERIIVDSAAIGGFPNPWACRRRQSSRWSAACPKVMCEKSAIRTRSMLTARVARCRKTTG